MASVPPRQRGFALVSVLFGGLIVALLLAMLIGAARDDAQVAHDMLARAVLRARAEGVTNLVILSLMDRRGERRARIDGVPATIAFDGQRFRVSVQDQAGLIDVNAADRDVLLRLFRAVGLDPAAADAMADRTLDWREPGPFKRLNGAKRDDYLAAGAAFGPDGTPFATPEEMRFVLGMTEPVYRAIRPVLTVVSGAATVNPLTAPALALEAAGLTRREAELAMAARETAAPAGAGPIVGGRLDAAIYPAGRAFAIRVAPEDDAAQALETIVRITDEPGRPVRVLAQDRPR